MRHDAPSRQLRTSTHACRAPSRLRSSPTRFGSVAGRYHPARGCFFVMKGIAKVEHTPKSYSQFKQTTTLYSLTEFMARLWDVAVQGLPPCRAQHYMAADYLKRSKHQGGQKGLKSRQSNPKGPSNRCSYIFKALFTLAMTALDPKPRTTFQIPSAQLLCTWTPRGLQVVAGSECCG